MKHQRNVQRAAALLLPPTIADFKTSDIGSQEIKKFGGKEMKYSNCNIVPSLLAKNSIL